MLKSSDPFDPVQQHYWPAGCQVPLCLRRVTGDSCLCVQPTARMKGWNDRCPKPWPEAASGRSKIANSTDLPTHHLLDIARCGVNILSVIYCKPTPSISQSCRHGHKAVSQTFSYCSLLVTSSAHCGYLQITWPPLLQTKFVCQQRVSFRNHTIRLGTRKVFIQQQTAFVTRMRPKQPNHVCYPANSLGPSHAWSLPQYSRILSSQSWQPAGLQEPDFFGLTAKGSHGQNHYTRGESLTCQLVEHIVLGHACSSVHGADTKDSYTQSASAGLSVLLLVGGLPACNLYQCPNCDVQSRSHIR